MKTREHSEAVALVETLFADLNDRSGFHTDAVSDEDLQKWKDEWTAVITAVMQSLTGTL